MSGNLKILVHKSWHVWKRENREKVARDERNFKEENERKDERERNLLQEKNLEELISAQEQLPKHSSDVAEPFRLFGDIEELDKKNKELKEQNQARKDKEFNDKKKSGEAPWALGEGAAEKIGSIVPYWYLKPSANTASSAASSSSSSRTLPFNSEWGGKECEEDAILKREELRKVAQDPMTGILKPSNKIREDSLSNTTEIGSNQVNLVRIKIEGESAMSNSSRLSKSSNASKNEKDFHHDEKEKKSKHKYNRRSESHDVIKHKKRKKSSKTHSDTDSDSNNDTEKRVKTEQHSKKVKDSRSRSSIEYDKYSSRSTDNSHSSSSAGRLNNDRTTSRSHSPSKSTLPTALHAAPPSTFLPTSTVSTSALRQRRMEREYAERKRATVVLARADIFGPLNALGVGGLPDGREQRYNQQFHPHIAR
jgi:hypothetical protein